MKYNYKTLWFFIFITCFGLEIKLLGLETETIQLNEEFLSTHDPIGRYMVTASDEESIMNPKSIMEGMFEDSFTGLEGKKAKGYGADRPWPHWAYFKINNPTDQVIVVYLEASYSALDKLTLYTVNDTGVILSEETLGDRIAFSKRPIQYRHPIYNLTLQPGINHFLTKIDTASMVVMDFTIYSDADLKNTKLKELVLVGLLLGGIATIFFYNLFLFVTTRDRNYGVYVIYVGSYFIFAMSYYGLAPYFLFNEAEQAPLTGWDLYCMIDLISIGAIAFTLCFLEGLKKHAPILFRCLQFFLVVAVLNAVLNLLILHGSIPATKKVTLIVSLLMGIFLVGAGVRRALQGYTPAIYFSFAWVFVITGNVLVLMSSQGILERNFLTAWGQLIGANLEMILLSFALGARINLMKAEKLKAEQDSLKAAEEKKKLQAELITTQEDNIRTLDAKVKEKTRAIREILTHINQGIFTFKEDLTLGAEFSDHLIDFLKEDRLAGRPLEGALFGKTNLSKDDISQSISTLGMSFGQIKEFGWDINEHALAKEFEIKGDNDTTLYIEADWGPITDDDGFLDKVLVSLRDVTEIRKLKAMAEAKGQEAAMLLEMLSNDLDKTQKFLSRTLKGWYIVDQTLNKYMEDTTESHATLFREYHTVKGNARSLGFKGIATAIHDLETQLKDLHGEVSESKVEALAVTSKETQKLINKYHTIFENKFARFMELETSGIKGQLFESFFGGSMTSSVNSIANDLNKPHPVINIENPQGFMIMNDEIEEVFINILNHLTRNSLDHGIEEADERKRKGKNASGEISIRISINENKEVKINFSDDGRGLNLSRIYDLGIQKRLFNESVNANELIETIFQPGFSTCQKTSMISGRGIGMDAVRHYALGMGASFNLILEHPIDDITLQKIKNGPAEDIFIGFSFESNVNLKSSAEKWKKAG